MKFTHIIWDYDGTIFDSYPVMGAALREAFNGRGIAEPLENIIALMKVSIKNAVAFYSEKYRLDENFWTQCKELRKKAEMESTKPFEGVTELLRTIKKRGGKNYLLTHRGGSSKYFLDKYGLLLDFDELITSENNFPRKPSPEAINYLIEKYKFPREQALMIGDRDIDILAGKNAGIHTCFFANGGEPFPDAEFNINCFSELLAVV